MVKDDAPMARITPISRRRSSTLIESVPANPIAPTTAIKIDMIISSLVTTPN
jgi:hypothetical protein